jgi:4'-phosphopantetheinyl transferase
MSDAELIRPRRFVCNPDEVHVWRVVLDLEREELSALATLLSNDEYDESSGFRCETLRCRWIAAHGAMRVILAAYTEIAPGALCFVTEPAGKPKLVTADLSFNLTHTEHLAFVAIAAEGLVGIDAEIMHSEFPWEGVAPAFFAREEVSAIRQLAPELRARAFYACWTRREAYLKALGFGLHAAFDKFQVAVGPDEPLLLLVDGDTEQAAQWGLMDLGEAGVAVALATNPAKTIARRFTFSMPLLSMEGRSPLSNHDRVHLQWGAE